MKIRALLTAGAAIATVAGAAITGQGAGAATSVPAAVAASTARASAHPVSASTFKNASGHVTHGKIAGITRTTNARLGRASGTRAGAAGTSAAAASCTTEPNCDLVYNGGPVQHAPKVYLMFWGPAWASNSYDNSAAGYLQHLFKGLGASPDTWSSDTSQYGDKSGHATFGSLVFANYHIDKTTPPNPITFNDLANEAANAASVFNISASAAPNAQIIVATQSGTCYEDEPGVGLFAGSCGQVQTSSTYGLYCGYHSYDFDPSDPSVFLPWVALPFQPDAGNLCGQGFINFGAGTFDGFGMVGGHEYAETITDPDLTAWYDPNDSVSGGEIADKCAWEGLPWNQSPPDPAGNLTLSTGTFAMQSLWSNATHSCVMTGLLPLSVSTPPSQSSILGQAVTLQISATVGGTTPLTYSASGLPPGLSINKSTGQISGKPGTTAGLYKPTVRVSYYAGSKSVTFAWHVSSAPGFITGYGYKCVDNYAGHLVNANKIVLAYCSGATEQRITFKDNRQLQVQGWCIAVPSSAIALEPCSTSTREVWTHLSNNEYVNAGTGKCLTDPNHSTVNGIQLIVATCANTTNQHWSLPVALIGPIRGYGSKCVDDAGGSTAHGNKIDISTCQTTTAQRITLAAGSQLQVLGFCINNGTDNKVNLEPCITGAKTEFWRYLPNQEWINAASQKCLTDPNNSTVNGTQLIVAACANTANQHWTLP